MRMLDTSIRLFILYYTNHDYTILSFLLFLYPINLTIINELYGLSRAKCTLLVGRYAVYPLITHAPLSLFLPN